MPDPMSLKMHLLIWEDFGVALALVLFVLWNAWDSVKTG